MLLDKGIDDMELLLSRYDADGASFLDGDPKRLLPDLYYLGDLSGVSVYGFFASSKLYLVNAPGGSGLVGFIASRLQQLGLRAATPAAVLLTSCGPTETAGSYLFDAYHPRVVAGGYCRRKITEICGVGATVVTAEDLAP